MSFEVAYNGDIQYVKIFYSTEKTREGKYYGDLYKKMDALAKDLKRLKDELEEDSEKAAKIFKDAGNKALAERFGALRYIVDNRLWDEDMIISKMLDSKKEEMLALAQKTFNNEVLLEEDGAEEYKIHLEDGSIEVDGKHVDIDVSSQGELFGETYYEWNETELEKLEQLNWFVIWRRTEEGRFRTKLGKMEGAFSKTQIRQENNLLYYGDLSLDESSPRTKEVENELEIFFGDKTRESFEIN